MVNPNLTKVSFINLSYAILNVIRKNENVVKIKYYTYKQFKCLKFFLKLLHILCEYFFNDFYLNYRFRSTLSR